MAIVAHGNRHQFSSDVGISVNELKKSSKTGKLRLKSCNAPMAQWLTLSIAAGTKHTVLWLNSILGAELDDGCDQQAERQLKSLSCISVKNIRLSKNKD